MLPWLANGQFPLYLAPMAGFTDSIYRSLCKKQGADVVITEFVLADRILHSDPKIWKMVDFSPDQRPMGIQIFGSSPEVMGEAAKRLRERLAPDFIDLNFGCPADNITCRDAGSSLLRNLPRMGEIAAAVVAAAAPTPVTAKIRIGWDDDSVVALPAGEILAASGIQALTIHGRTKEQGYRGRANWEVIGEVAAQLSIPVIGNGDIASAEDVWRVRQTTACAGVMIGRAALGRPWLFREIKSILQHGVAPPPIALEERWEIILEYARELERRLLPPGQEGKLGWMRSRLISLTKDMRGSKKLRNAITRLQTVEELMAIDPRDFAVNHRETD